MRHLELPIVKLDDSDIKNECNIDIKNEDLEDLDIKDELLGFGDFTETLKSLIELQSYEGKDQVSNNRSDNIEDDLRLCTNSNNYNLPQLNIDLVDKNFQSAGIQISDNKNNKKSDINSTKTKDKKNWKLNWGFKCMQCKKSWTTKNAFDEHYRTDHVLPPMYMCSYCNKTTDKYSTYRSHCYSHAMEGRFRCTECDKAYSTKSMLTTHQKLKHYNLEPFFCDHCEKSFKTCSKLKEHQQHEHAEEPNLFRCEECGKNLRTKGGLTSHMAAHKLDRRFMCHLCGKTYTQKVNLQIHVKEHIGYRPYICEVCGKNFAERSRLSRHSQFHTNVRSWHCNICDRFYKTKRCLKVHKLVHSEHRPHSCRYCGKGFLSSTKLKQHLNVHTGERPYKCQLCEKSFTNYPNWLKHVRRKHPNEADQLKEKRNGETIDHSRNIEQVEMPSFENGFKSLLSLPLPTM